MSQLCPFESTREAEHNSLNIIAGELQLHALEFKKLAEDDPPTDESLGQGIQLLKDTIGILESIRTRPALRLVQTTMEGLYE